MASQPPFLAEDSADEDFFDNLVDEDYKAMGSDAGLADGIESDEPKAFSKMTISNVGPTLIESTDSSFNSGDRGHSKTAGAQLSDGMLDEDVFVGKENNSLVTADSIAAPPKCEDSVSTKDAELDSTTSESILSRGKSIKEVQWSAFSTDSIQQNTGRVGSESDFFTGLADRSEDPFETVASNPMADFDPNASLVGNSVTNLTSSFSSSQHQMTDRQLWSDNQNLESLYPGWRMDPATGQWHPDDGSHAMTSTNQAWLQEQALSTSNAVFSDCRPEVSYLQQTAQSVVGTLVDDSATTSVSNWNQVGSSQYPANMVFDPQYPGWYYDTIKNEWFTLESYIHTVQTPSTAGIQQIQDQGASPGVSEKDHSLYGEFSQFEQYNSQAQSNQGGDWTATARNYSQAHAWQPKPVAQSGVISSFSGNQQMGNLYGSTDHVNTYGDQQTGFKTMETVSMHGQANPGYDSNRGVIGFQPSTSTENLYRVNQPTMEQGQQNYILAAYYGNQKSLNYDLQTRNASCKEFSYAPKRQWPSAGRPPHALVTFGFGGNLVVMKDTSSSYGSQGIGGSSISILNLGEVVTNKTDAAASFGTGISDYFRALCHQSFPGPLVGGNAATKELYKWVDERIANCQTPNMDYRKGELLKLLFALLKISCQHYGKLRSPFGVDPSLQESDGPESSVAKLFASARRSGSHVSKYGAITPCLQSLPSEGQIKATAVEVQNLLVSGRRKEALQCAQEGHLWGPALVLASQLGDKFYVDTVKQMAHYQFVSGSPLRTLCLLIAGQPADVFTDSSTTTNTLGTLHVSQQPTQLHENNMLDDWEENLAVITANRTKDDELVIIHLGDCMWKDRGEIAAAHACYLVADANFESYSDSARLCLIGADHWKSPRTFASPEAIQMTELYEFSKVLGNSQFIFLPFQPYKLIYAFMLAEVGKISDSLKYCQATLKMLKNSSRAPEVEILKSLLSSLEDRIRTHQQSGYSTNLAPGKLVGKLFTSIDRSISRMIGAPPTPVLPASQSSLQSDEHDSYPVAPKMANSQSTMVMSSLMPSASEWTGDSNRMSATNRSVSEPDFGRSSKQINPSKEVTSTGGTASVAGGASRFGRFGSQLLQKTVGWVSRSRTDRQAKLGDPLKLVYDNKLKRWVEEGVEMPTEETALPPPPTTASFQNHMLADNRNGGLKSESSPPDRGLDTKRPNPSEHSSGLPPIPPGSNQFSARGRGLRSRYVDTFNKGGGNPTNLFQSPSVPVAKPASGAKFFVPAPVASVNQRVDATGESVPEVAPDGDPSTSVTTVKGPSMSAMTEPSFPLHSSSISPLQRHPSMDSIAPTANREEGTAQNRIGRKSSHSRAASWGGSINDSFNTKTSELRPLGEVLGMPPSTFMPSEPSLMGLNNNLSQMNSGGNFGDDLHEVEL